MNTIKKLILFFTKRRSKSSPILIIKKQTTGSKVKEYQSIEEAITDLEKDPNVSRDKIEKLKSSLNNLKNTTSIKIRNGDIIK